MDPENQPQIILTVGLDEAIKTDTQPTFFYQLSGSDKEPVEIEYANRLTPQEGEVQTWQAVFTTQKV